MESGLSFVFFVSRGQQFLFVLTRGDVANIKPLLRGGPGGCGKVGKKETGLQLLEPGPFPVAPLFLFQFRWAQAHLEFCNPF